MTFFYRVFLKGLIALLPIIITIYLLVWAATRAESAFGAPLREWLPAYLYFPGAGVVLVVALIFIVGLLVNTYITQRFIVWLEAQIATMPIISSIYSPIRDVTQLFGSSSSGSQRVVLVRPYGTETEILGLLTRDDFSELPANPIAIGSVAVFIPFSYAMGGQTVIVPKTLVRETTIHADKAMQLALTAWIKSKN